MSKIDDKYFSFLPYSNGYNYQDKQRNVQTYVKYMVNRSLAMFQYHDLPDTIPQEELEKMLQCGGLAVWYKHNNELYVFNANLGGEGDVYNRPTKAIISNPYLKLNKECIIDEDCILMLNDSLAVGLIPMYQKYCTIINETDISLILGTVNKRIQILLSANDDNTVASAKQFIKNIEDGKLGVIAESKLFDSLKTNSVSTSQTNGLQEVWELQQFLKASMYNEIGLNANWNNKREKLNSSEVEMNTDNLYPLVDNMLDCRRKALEKVNEMFGTNITVEFNSSWDYRVFNGESIHNVETEINMNELDETSETENEPTIEPTETNTETNIEPSDGVSDEQKEGETNDEQSEKRGTEKQSDVAEQNETGSEQADTEDEEHDNEQSEEQETEGEQPVADDEVNTDDTSVKDNTDDTDNEESEEKEDESKR